MQTTDRSFFVPEDRPTPLSLGGVGADRRSSGTGFGSTPIHDLLADLADPRAVASTPPSPRERLAFQRLAGKLTHDRYCAELRKLPRERTTRAMRGAPRARARQSRRKVAGSAARAPASDGDPEPPRRRPVGGGVQRIGVATIDPFGVEHVVIVEADPARSTPDEWITIARRAVGWDAEVASIRAADLGARWQTITPGATRGGVA